MPKESSHFSLAGGVTLFTCRDHTIHLQGSEKCQKKVRTSHSPGSHFSFARGHTFHLQGSHYSLAGI